MKSYTFAGTIFLDNLTVSELKSRTGGGIILLGDIGTSDPIFFSGYGLYFSMLATAWISLSPRPERQISIIESLGSLGAILVA